jgi:type II secretory pathway component PulM
MTTTTVQRNRRALILLGAAVVLYVGSTQFVFPWYDRLSAASGDVTQKTDQLRKYRRELLHQGNYEALTADISKKITDARPYFFNEPTELQKVVENGAKTVGIDLTQRSATQTKKVDELVNEISMTVAFESTPGQLVRFLEQLRESPQIVNVKTAQIDPAQVVLAAPKTGEFRKTLRVNLTIAGQSSIVADGKVN